MKQALLAVTQGCTGGVNIGDYIQALAAKQFLKDADVFIERETELASYDGEPVKMIMNGWYMNHPENWPPSSKIHPLYVALHINKSSLPRFLEKESLSYFKKYEPIGCRDINSQKLLEGKGIKAYFSGCLTLTLGYKYKSQKRTNKVYVVEPPTIESGLYCRNKWESLLTMVYLLFHFQDVYSISQKKGQRGIKSLFYNSFFLKQYSKVFDRKMLVDAEYVNQYNEEIIKEHPTNEALLTYAEQLVKMYAEAACVITSRIHCALPCLGLETPVIFINDVRMHKNSADRLGGIISLFNVISWDGFKLLSNCQSPKKICKQNFPNNKTGWKDIARKLIDVCLKFANDEHSSFHRQ